MIFSDNLLKYNDETDRTLLNEYNFQEFLMNQV